MSTTDVSSELDDLRRRLVEQAEVFDSPDYEAGVLDAFDAIALLLDDERSLPLDDEGSLPLDDEGSLPLDDEGTG